MKLILILICGIYINPNQVQGLIPISNGTECNLVTAHNSINRDLPIPCDEAARILNGQEPSKFKGIK